MSDRTMKLTIDFTDEEFDRVAQHVCNSQYGGKSQHSGTIAAHCRQMLLIAVNQGASLQSPVTTGKNTINKPDVTREKRR